MIDATNIYNPAEIDLNQHAVIEASAGTGKTYTIQKLVVRLIVEKNLDLSEILIVTFTEKATGELKDRIFKALVEAREEQPDHEIALSKALERFSEAKIFTIHSFCQRLLQEFAFENGSSFQVQLTKDEPIYRKVLNIRKRAWQADPAICQLLRENYKESKVDNLLISLAAKSTAGAIYFPLEESGSVFDQLLSPLLESLKAFQKSDFEVYPKLGSLVKAKQKYEDIVEPIFSLLAHQELTTQECYEAISNLLPVKFNGDFLTKVTSGKNKVDYETEMASTPQLYSFSAVLMKLFSLKKKCANNAWYSFLKSESDLLHKDVKVYKEERSLLSFDDMIDNVYESLHSSRSALLKKALRKSLKVGLIDEFQDTDLKQWSLFKSIFFEEKNSEHLLYIIGDPKQAIYRFRGADINAYLTARHELLDAGAHYYNLPVNWRSLPNLTNSLNKLFKSDSWFQSQVKSDWEILFRDSLNQDDMGTELRQKQGPCLYEDTSGSELVNFMKIDEEELDDWQLKASMADAYVQKITELVGRVRYQIKGRHSQLKFKDCCILIRNRQDFKPLEKSLDLAGIPYSFYKQTGVYQSVEAYSLYYLLLSLSEPGNIAWQKRVFVTDLFDISVDEVLTDSEVDPQHSARQQWMNLLELALANKWSVFFRTLTYKNGLLERLYGRGESHTAAAYEQLADELLKIAVEQNLTVKNLAETLLGFIETYTESESDYHDKEASTDAVKIMTMHSSKGLEFPVVFVFGGFSDSKERNAGYHKYFEPLLQSSVIDLTLTSSASVEQEAAAEIIRLFYVACTRAVLKLFLPSIEKKSVAQKLFGGSKNSLVKSEVILDLEDAATLELSAAPPVSLANFDSEELPRLSHRKMGIYSFSSLAHFSVDQEAVSFNETAKLTAKYDDLGHDDYHDESEGLILPRGASTGDLLHEILENLDFTLLQSMKTADELLVEGSECLEIINKALKKYPLVEKTLRNEQGQVVDSSLDALARMIFHTLKAPILELGAMSLSECAQHDTLREAEFHMPSPDGKSYITGFIDLIIRVAQANGNYLYYVVDWKTTSVKGDYFRESLEHSMNEKKYTLQYELYNYAVHRWFKQHFSERHTLAGAIYIYLRGMNVSYPGRGVYFTEENLQFEVLEEQLGLMIGKSVEVKK